MKYLEPEIQNCANCDYHLHWAVAMVGFPSPCFCDRPEFAGAHDYYCESSDKFVKGADCEFFKFNSDLQAWHDQLDRQIANYNCIDSMMGPDLTEDMHVFALFEIGFLLLNLVGDIEFDVDLNDDELKNKFMYHMMESLKGGVHGNCLERTIDLLVKYIKLSR